MRHVGLWQITEDGPEKLKQGQIDLERDLEEWIEHDPNMLQEGLTIVGRQIVLDSGRLDLLALDTQGRWVVIEIKSGLVSREALAQVLDYTASIAMMPQEELYEKVKDYLDKRGVSRKDLLAPRGIQDDEQEKPREVSMYVAGTRSDPALQRMVDYLSTVYKVPISLVSYRVFDVAGGQRILVRELTETESASSVPDAKSPRATVEALCVQAEQAGVGSQFRMLLEAAKRYDLYPRPYKRSIMYTPPSDHRRMLFTVQAEPDAKGRLWVYMGPEAFAEFYAVTEEMAQSQIGPSGWRNMTAEDVRVFVDSLDRLFASVESEQ